MLKIIGWLVTASFFAVAVLVIGNSFEVKNRTISDRVRTQLSHAEHQQIPHVIETTEETVNDLKEWAKNLASKQKQGIEKRYTNERRAHALTKASPESKAKQTRLPANTTSAPRIAPPETHKRNEKLTASSGEEIPTSERQKLQDLMRELNSSRTNPQ